MDKYCINCGNKIDPNADICLKCGKIINQKNKKDDKLVWLFLSFLAPIIAMVLYLALKDRKENARIILIGTLTKILFIIIAVLIIYFVYFM